MRKTLVGIAIVLMISSTFLVSACANDPGDSVVRRDGEPDVHSVAADDSQMNGAMAQARATFDLFVEQLDSPKPGQRYFAVKVRLEDGEAVEHAWLDEPIVSGDSVRGYLANEPLDVTGYSIGQELTTTRDHVSDWMYVEDDELRGGFTIRVLRDKVSAEERAAFDAGLDFVIRSDTTVPADEYPDMQVLLQLEQAGSDLSKEHLIEFYLYFPSKGEAESAAGDIAGDAFDVVVEPAAGGSQWLCFATKAMVPDHPVLVDTRSRFELIAARYGGVYDGWGTEVVR